MPAVLIVEDTDTQAALLRRYLQDQYTVVERVRTADEAVRAARETSPDIVVMDLNLAEGNGIEATKSISALDESIRIVVSTVYVDEDVQTRALDAGADAYLFKPYTRQELLSTVEDVLG
jgi:two-component system chemotaxis response regulator CheY